MKLSTACLLLFAFVTTAAGCSALSVVADDQNQLAIKYATAKVLERSDVSATYLLERVEQAKTYVDAGVEVSVSGLVDAARFRLAESSLSPADQILIEAVLARAEERIKARLGDGLLATEQRIQLLTVLEWVESAASLYATR